MKNIEKTALFLGGAGFLGSHLATALLKSNYRIIIFDRPTADYGNLKCILDKIQIVKGIFGDIKVIEEIVKSEKVDIVFHLISTILPSSSISTVDDDIEDNLINTIKLISLMNEYKINKLVYFSSGGTVYGKNGLKINSEKSETNPINVYGWLKLTIEKYIQMYHASYNLEYLIVRIANPYGPKQNLYGKQGLIAVILGKILQNQTISIWGDGNVVRDYIYIDDVINAIIGLISKDCWNEIYNIGRGVGVSVNQILDQVQASISNEIKIEYFDSRPVDIPVNILDTSKLSKAIYWEETTPLDVGIKKTWEWVQNTARGCNE